MTEAEQETAEFKRLRAMKEKLSQIYREMRLKPAKEEEVTKEIAWPQDTDLRDKLPHKTSP